MREVVADAQRLLRACADTSVRWKWLGTVVLVCLGGLLAALAPLALKGMVDALTTNGSASTGPTSAAVLLLGLTYILALGTGRVIAELRPLLAGTAEQRLLARLAHRIFSHLLDLPMQFHLSRRSGELVHAVHMASRGCQLLTTHLVNSVLPVLVEIVAIGLILAQLGQPALVACFAATALAYLTVFSAASLTITARAQQVSDASMGVNATLTDALANYETIKTFAAEPTFLTRLAGATKLLELRWHRLYLLRARIGGLVAVIFTLSVAASLGLAASAVDSGTLTIGGFVLANVYMLQVVRPLETLGSATRDISQALGWISPALDLLRQPTESSSGTLAAPSVAGASIVTPSKHGAAPHAAPSIRFERVWFAHDAGRPVFRGLRLQIPSGSTMGIVGTSGSGKSSLARLLMRLHEPQSGRILLDGIPIQSLSHSLLRSLVAMVPQDTTLFNETLAYNIGVGRPGASQAEIEQAAQRAQLHHIVAALPAGYDTVVGQRGLKLSGGERQRVAIARALLKAPPVMVLDEATSMLDSRTEAAILHELQAATARTTTIMIAHRLSTVQRADNIVVLGAGRIVEQGTHAALLAQGGAYAALWNRQMRDGSPPDQNCPLLPKRVRSRARSVASRRRCA